MEFRFGGRGAFHAADAKVNHCRQPCWLNSHRSHIWNGFWPAILDSVGFWTAYYLQSSFSETKNVYSVDLFTTFYF